MHFADLELTLHFQLSLSLSPFVRHRFLPPSLPPSHRSHRLTSTPPPFAPYLSWYTSRNRHPAVDQFQIVTPSRSHHFPRKKGRSSPFLLIRKHRYKMAQGESSSASSSRINSQADLFPIQESSSHSHSQPNPNRNRRRHSTGVRETPGMTSITNRVRRYLGVEDNTPESVGAIDFLKVDSSEVKSDVSVT